MSKKNGKKEAEDREMLEKFDIKINEFGELTSNLPIEELNAFLNKNLADKKLKNRLSEEE